MSLATEREPLLQNPVDNCYSSTSDEVTIKSPGQVQEGVVVIKVSYQKHSLLPYHMIVAGYYGDMLILHLSIRPSVCCMTVRFFVHPAIFFFSR